MHLARTQKRVDELQQKLMQKTEELAETREKHIDAAERISALTTQLRQKDDEMSKKENQYVRDVYPSYHCFRGAL